MISVLLLFEKNATIMLSTALQLFSLLYINMYVEVSLFLFLKFISVCSTHPYGGPIRHACSVRADGRRHHRGISMDGNNETNPLKE